MADNQALKLLYCQSLLTTTLAKQNCRRQLLLLLLFQVFVLFSTPRIRFCRRVDLSVRRVAMLRRRDGVAAGFRDSPRLDGPRPRPRPYIGPRPPMLDGAMPPREPGTGLPKRVGCKWYFTTPCLEPPSSDGPHLASL